jgi:N-methylhydantoinase B
MMHTFPDIPINGGCFRPFTHNIPDATFLAAQWPMPIGGYVDCANRVIDCVFGAIAKADATKVRGACFGTGGVVVVAGNDPLRGYYVAVLPYGGGYGASDAGDGLIFGTSIIGNANFPSIEASEHDFALIWHRFGIRDSSGGAGRNIGGCGAIYDFEILSDATCSVLGDRVLFQPFGIAGGLPGAGNSVEIIANGKPFPLPFRSKGGPFELPKGSRVVVKSPGGGGYGPPGDRRPDLVERDVRVGYFSAKEAIDTFGVNITAAIVESTEDFVPGGIRRTRA